MGKQYNYFVSYTDGKRFYSMEVKCEFKLKNIQDINELTYLLSEETKEDIVILNFKLFK